MNLSVNVIKAIETGRELAKEHSAEVLLSAAMNAVTADTRIHQDDAARIVALLGATFSMLTAEEVKPAAGN